MRYYIMLLIKNLNKRIYIKLNKKNIKLGILTRINTDIKNWDSSEKEIRVDRAVLTGNIKLNSGVKIFKDVSLTGNIEIGKYTSISGNGTVISGVKNKIKIGNFCSIAPNVMIIGDYHNYKKVTTYFIFSNIFNKVLDNEKVSKGNIIIEDDVWIGANTVVLSGVKIGRGSIIGAGSIISKDIPPYSIVCGKENKIIKKRFSPQTIERLEKSKWWNWGKNTLLENQDFFEKELEC